MSLRYISVSLFLAGFAFLTPKVEADCTQCQQACQGQCSRCKCGGLNITKIVYKRNSMGGGLIGAAPPQGFAVSSVPAVMLQTPAFAATPAFAVSSASFAPASASLTDQQIKQITDAIGKANAAPAAAATPTTTCDDPCGKILQLRKDVDDLLEVTRRLTVAVDRLADNVKPVSPK